MLTSPSEEKEKEEEEEEAEEEAEEEVGGEAEEEVGEEVGGEKETPSFVYLLQSANRRYTYVGATKNVHRRLRQHNGEIKGGAKMTTRQAMRGNTWSRILYVSNFPTWQSALQFEWKWKFLTRKSKKRGSSLEKRMDALTTLLGSLQSTSSALPFASWPLPPVVHRE